METKLTESTSQDPEPLKKGRGGRHPKEENQLRVHRIRSNATAEEYQRIRTYYADQTLGRQISIGQFMIDTVLANTNSAKPVKPIKAGMIDPDVLRRYRIDLNSLKNELGPMANNYNQSVKRINSLFVAAALKKEVNQSNHLIAQLPQLLTKLNALLDHINQLLAASKNDENNPE